MQECVIPPNDILTTVILNERQTNEWHSVKSNSVECSWMWICWMSFWWMSFWLIVILLDDTRLNVIIIIMCFILISVILSYFCWVTFWSVIFPECHTADFHCYTSCTVWCHSTKSNSAFCHSAQCHSPKCRGAIITL